jgi:AAA domain, putative AbiEii toxin, Type IV TA system/AAA ATPase domain
VKVTSIRVKNHKCHLDTGELRFGRRFTVIVGQNSAGKTALLEALNPRTFRDVPHRTPHRGPFPPVINPLSEIEYDILLSGKELEHAFLTAGGQFAIPVPHGTDIKTSAPGFVSGLFARSELTFRLSHPASAGWNSKYPSHGLFEGPANPPSVLLNINTDRQGWTTPSITSGDSLPPFIGGRLENSIYGFRAERLNIGESAIADSALLLPDASNLPSVLLQLPGSPAAHDRYLTLIREIFPSIYRISARPIHANMAKIEIIMNDYESDRPSPGINVSLSESGTGISQVLAMLYVAVTAETPRIIIIDEPNSFLHPGAAKKLLTILKQFDHQYIISTHSAELIRVADPEYLHLIEWAKTASAFRTLDRKNLDDQRRLLEELGISLSDVFGADKVLWVEGPTEERCFPMILDHLKCSSPALSIASVIATDDLTGRSPRAKLSWDVYRKLSTGNALIPPALAFSFDREGRSLTEMADLERMSANLVKFLPRRMYENYVLHPEAIADVLTTAVGTTIGTATVSAWMVNQKEAGKYVSGKPRDDEDWFANADASGLLQDLFNELTDAKVEFRKTEHSVALTKWILANDPEYLDELYSFLRSLVSA